MKTDNPYSAPDDSVAHSTAPNDVQTLESNAKSIFLAWEKLRLVYVGILVIETLALGGLAHSRLFELDFWLVVLAGAVVANVCFLLGPIIEAYVAWLGFPTRALRLIMFVAGTLFSCLLAAITIVLVTTPLSN